MTTIISFVLVLGILILVHEFGHFIVARMSGVGVERFSIGFGPVLARYRGKETEYCLSLVPLGGYVKMMGDDENPLEGGKTGTLDPKRAFNLKPLAVRFLIVFAGPAMNFVLAVVIFALVFMILGRPVAPAVIGRVVESGPVAQAGLKTGDRITAIDGRPVQYWEDVQRAVQDSRGGDALAHGAAGRGRRAQGRRHAGSDEDARSLRRRAPDVGHRCAALRAAVDRRSRRGVSRPESGTQERRRHRVARGEARAVLGRAGRRDPATPRPADPPRGQAGRRDVHRSPSCPTRSRSAVPTARRSRSGASGSARPRASASSARTRFGRSERGSIARSR